MIPGRFLDLEPTTPTFYYSENVINYGIVRVLIVGLNCAVHRTDFQNSGFDFFSVVLNMLEVPEIGPINNLMYYIC